MGADEQAADRHGLAAGGESTATIRLPARSRRRPLEPARPPCPAEEQKIVVDSHTDGTSAVEDNGRRAAGDDALSRQPARARRCTGAVHLYHALLPAAHEPCTCVTEAQAISRAGWTAKSTTGGTWPAWWCSNTSARAIRTVPSGRPGWHPSPDRRPRLLLVPVGPSRALERAVRKVVSRHRLGPRGTACRRRHRGRWSDAHHCSFGGQGTPYNERLLPACADRGPAFGLRRRFRPRGIDFGIWTQTRRSPTSFCGWGP